MNTCKYIVNQITRQIYWTAYCIVLFFSFEHFGNLGVNLNGLVVKVLDSQFRSLIDSAFHPSEADKMSTRIKWVYCHWGGYKSQWSTMKCFNWEHSNFHIMHKLTNLFCLTILFSKFNILGSFILHFLANIEGYMPTRFSNGARA